MTASPTDHNNDDEHDAADDRRYTCAFKERCVKEVLAEYRSFLNLPHYPEDVRLLLMLTMRKMIEHANSNKLHGEHPSTLTDDDDVEPWKLAELNANMERLLRRYRFDANRTSLQNLRAFVTQLLCTTPDTTVDYL